MSISIAEAAKVLGVTEKKVMDLQEAGHLPQVIPDDYFDTFIAFRLRIEQAHIRKMARLAAQDAHDE